MRTNIAVVAIVAALLSAGCATHDTDAGNAPSAPPPTKIARAELASGARGVSQVASEDVRVVTAVAGRAMYSTNEVDPTIPVTHQAFTTVRSIRGAVPESFVVEFTGGPTEEGGTKYVLELEGQPQFEQGKTYFLVLMGPKPTGEFFVFGGAQGRYELNGKELTPAKGADPGDAVVSALAGRDVEHAAALLRGQ